MRMHESLNDSDWADRRVEAYVDGDLAGADLARFQSIVAEDPLLEAAIADAKRIRTSLKAMDSYPCPPDLTRSILSQVRSEVRASWWIRIRLAADWLWPTVWQPSLSMATLAGIVLIAALWRGPGAGETDPQVTRALAEAKWTIAYLAEVGRKTGTTVRDDVLTPYVARSVTNAVNRVFEPPEPEPSNR